VATAELAFLMEEKEKSSPNAKEAELHQAAYEQLVMLSNYLLGDRKTFGEPAEIKTFCERVKYSITVMLREFKELLRGRKLFQKQYTAFATGPQSGTQIFRVEEREGEIGPYLFSWDSRGEETANDLEKALNELKYHQLAFLSGFRTSIKEGTKEILQKIDPAKLETELMGRGVSIAGLKIPFKLLPFRKQALWKEYKRRYDELMQQEEQHLEAKFRTHFRQGYVSFMATKAMGKKEK
jgi:hypothetical protein